MKMAMVDQICLPITGFQVIVNHDVFSSQVLVVLPTHCLGICVALTTAEPLSIFIASPNFNSDSTPNAS
jgi:hypothetical protein